jgi:hypothetical protein
MAAKKKNVIQKTFTVPQLAVETRRLARVIQMDSLGRYVSNGPASLNTKTKKGFEVKYSFTGGTLSQGVAKPGAQPGQTKPVASSSGTSLSGVTIEIAQDLTHPNFMGFTYPGQSDMRDIAKTILHEQVHAAIFEFRANNVQDPASLVQGYDQALVAASKFLATNATLGAQLTQTQFPGNQFGPPAELDAVDEWFASRLELKSVGFVEPPVHLASRYVSSVLKQPAASGSSAFTVQAQMLGDLFAALDAANIV